MTFSLTKLELYHERLKAIALAAHESTKNYAAENLCSSFFYFINTFDEFKSIRVKLVNKLVTNLAFNYDMIGSYVLLGVDGYNIEFSVCNMIKPLNSRYLTALYVLDLPNTYNKFVLLVADDGVHSFVGKVDITKYV